MSDFKRKFGHGPYADYGQGTYMQELPGLKPRVYEDFTKGYSAEQLPQPGASRSMLDIELTDRKTLRRVPGIVQLEKLQQQAEALIVHRNLDGSAELVVFAPPWLGVRLGDSFTWTDLGLPASRSPIAWANFGGTLILSNGNEKVWSRQAFVERLDELPEAPPALLYAVFAGRVVAAGALIDGRWEPAGIAWSAASSDYRDWTGLGAGFELLISNSRAASPITAMQVMGLDMLVISTENSLWVGRPTGLVDRPIDSSLRVEGKGFISQKATAVTPLGVVGLAEDAVYLFDGNGLQDISEPIRAEIFPLSIEQIKSYRMSYFRQTNSLMLFTPEITWVFDLTKLRWTPRSVRAKDAVQVSTFTQPVKWSDLAALTWADLDQQWRDFNPEELTFAEPTYLMTSADSDYLGREDRASFSNMGIPLMPSYRLTAAQPMELLGAEYIGRGLIRYTGAGAVQLYYPRVGAEGEAFVDLVLADQQRPLPTRFGVGLSSAESGPTLRIREGDPEIYSVTELIQPQEARFATS